MPKTRSGPGIVRIGDRSEAQDPELISRIQQRAYLLFEAGGFEHGRDLEHWLEAERQITGSWDRSER